jgi:hypothetical protein
MLLCLSSHRWRVLEEPVEIAGEVALEAAGRFAAAPSLLGSPVDVVDRRLVQAAAGDDDLVEGAVEFPVAAAVEPVADRLTRRGGDRGCAGEAGEGRFASEASGV